MNWQHYDNEKLKRAREKAELTQGEVAERLDKDRQTIYRVDAGVMCSYELLCEYTALLDVDVTDFLYSRPLAEAAECREELAA